MMTGPAPSPSTTSPRARRRPAGGTAAPHPRNDAGVGRSAFLGAPRGVDHRHGAVILDDHPRDVTVCEVERESPHPLVEAPHLHLVCRARARATRMRTTTGATGLPARSMLVTFLCIGADPGEARGDDAEGVTLSAGEVKQGKHRLHLVGAPPVRSEPHGPARRVPAHRAVIAV
jgi:hypothetical protein